MRKLRSGSDSNAHAICTALNEQKLSDFEISFGYSENVEELYPCLARGRWVTRC